MQHRLRDIDKNARSIGMSLNVKKTNLIFFNPSHTRQAIPFVSILDGSPLLCVETMRLLGLVFDHKLEWWPLIGI